MTVATQQRLILIGFSTLCGVVLASFLGLIVYAVVHDGSVAAGILNTLQTTLQWGIGGIAGVLGIHTAVAGGLMGRAAATPPPAVPPPAAPVTTAPSAPIQPGS